MGVDGPEFLHAIVEAMQEKYPIDSKRIYLFGHSAGGVFALYMGVMEPQYFAATGIHAGTMNESFYSSLDNVTKRKLPLAIWVGTEDPYFFPDGCQEHTEHAEGTRLRCSGVRDERPCHDYYAVAKDLNPKIWTFLSASSLETDARWQTYRIAEPRKLRISSGVAGGERIVASWLLCLMHTKLFIIPVLYILVRGLLPMKLKPELVESQELVEKSA